MTEPPAVPPPGTRRPAAAVLLVLGGVAGVAQAFLPWVPAEPWVTGLDVAGSGLTLGTAAGTVGSVAVFVVLGGGVLAAVLGGVQVRRVRRAAALTAFVVGVLMTAGLAFVATTVVESGGAFELFRVGAWLFAVAGPLTLLGAALALRRDPRLPHSPGR